jgi:malate synthase
MDAWHKANPGPIADMKAYRAFLEKTGYLVPSPKKVTITTGNVDAELSKQAGPQLVVPILNARYALNAANARWGSLYDALYGTDVISEENGATKGKGYNPVRGAKVIEYARYVLDRTAPLKKGSHIDSTGYAVKGGKLVVTSRAARQRRWKTPASSSATRARRRRLRRCCCSTTACTWTSASTAQRPSARRMRPA